jgi:hypothetical protein
MAESFPSLALSIQPVHMTGNLRATLLLGDDYLTGISRRDLPLQECQQDRCDGGNSIYIWGVQDSIDHARVRRHNSL